MNVLTIMGSPHKSGKTATALNLLGEKIKAKGHEFERINITDYRIANCVGCNCCMSKTDTPGCVQKDDLSAILEKIVLSDAIVYATPLYSFSYSSQLKPFMDRHYCLLSTRLMAGKRVALLVTCAGKVEDNADLLQKPFEKAFHELLHADLIGEFYIPFSNAPDFRDRENEVTSLLSNKILHEDHIISV